MRHGLTESIPFTLCTAFFYYTNKQTLWTRLKRYRKLHLCQALVLGNAKMPTYVLL